MRWLLAVAEHKSFARAADSLGVSQPNLSSSMARLEDRLGGKLFLRTPMGSELTAFGKIIRDRVAKVVAEIDEIREDALLMARGELGVLRVGVGAMLPAAFATDLFSQLALAHPAAQLKVAVLERERIVSDLLRGELDVAVCVNGQEVDEQQFFSTQVMTSEILAVASPAHPLAQYASVTAEDFYRFPCATISVAAYGAPSIIECPRSPPAVGRYESNAYPVLLPLVLGGAATLLAPTYVAAPHLRDGTLVQLKIGVSAWARFHVLVRKSVRHMPLMQSAVSAAERVGAKLEKSANSPDTAPARPQLLMVS